MKDPVPAVANLWRIAVAAAALSRRARRIGLRLKNERPREAENTKAGAPTPAMKEDHP